MNLSWTHIMLLLVIGLLLFGPSKLPHLGRSLGESIRGFKKGLRGEDEDDEEVSVQKRDSERQQLGGHQQQNITQQKTEDSVTKTKQ